MDGTPAADGRRTRRERAMAVKQYAMTAAALVALAGCSDFDLDLRSIGNGFDTSDAAQVATRPRPAADANGLISYPGYQVAIARAGDTVSDVARRVGADPAALAQFNGIRDGVPLRSGETLVIPDSAGRRGPSGIDVAAIAGPAIERAGTVSDTSPVIAAPAGPEPQRHRVQPGETAFSISRLYNVSPAALADWNGLDASFNVRAGQVLLIPVPVTTAAAAPAPAATTVPGQGSVAPTPPSAATALPTEDLPPVAEAASAPEQPDLSAERTQTSRFMMPARGTIVRPYEKGKNDGIGISAAAGSPVRAAADGTVAAITRDTDQVPILVLRHEGNVLTVYAGVDNLSVEKGDAVTRGDEIAQIRSTGQPFLHFEVRDGFESVDPMPYLN